MFFDTCHSNDKNKLHKQIHGMEHPHPHRPPTWEDETHWYLSWADLNSQNAKKMCAPNNHVCGGWNDIYRDNKKQNRIRIWKQILWQSSTYDQRIQLPKLWKCVLDCWIIELEQHHSINKKNRSSIITQTSPTAVNATIRTIDKKRTWMTNRLRVYFSNRCKWTWNACPIVRTNEKTIIVCVSFSKTNPTTKVVVTIIAASKTIKPLKLSTETTNERTTRSNANQ